MKTHRDRQLRKEVNSAVPRKTYLSSLGLSPKSARTTRVKNRCIYTGRAGGLVRDYKCSRMILRERFAGSILSKSSW